MAATEVIVSVPVPPLTGTEPPISIVSTIVTNSQNQEERTTTFNVTLQSPAIPSSPTSVIVPIILTWSASYPVASVSQTGPPGSSQSTSQPQQTSGSSQSTSQPQQTSGSPTESPTGQNGTVAGGSGVSGGAVAGVAIGCLIAGAVIACIACFFLYRRRNQKQPAAYHQSHLPYDTEHKSGAAVRATPGPYAGMAAGSSLPQPVEDAAISKEVSRIRDSIKNHVQTFYHYQPVHRGVGSAELTALAAATNLDPAVVEGLLANPSTRGDSIRLFIAWAVLSRCEGPRQPTLLPSELAPILEAVAGQNGKDNAKSAWFRQWRVLTGALLEQQDGARSQASNMDMQNWTTIADGMDLVLGPFVPAGADEGKRRRNLEMVLGRAARLAFLLFSQPGSFHFDFAGSRPECLVVFPSLVQVAGDDGQALSPNKVLWQKEMAAD